jgi:hypothetical protein
LTGDIDLNKKESSNKKYPKIMYQQKENVFSGYWDVGDYCPPIPREPVPGWKVQDRIYISEKGDLFVGFNEPPNSPSYPSYSFGVLGDILVGDISFIERNPHQIGIRHSPLIRSTPTNIHSNRHMSSDNYGGASINLFSDETDSLKRKNVNSGYINLVAYGRGMGEKANSIRFLTRDKPNSTAERMIVKGDGKVGIGTKKPKEQLVVKGNIQVGNNEEPKGIVLFDEVNGEKHILKVQNGKLVLE